METKGERREAVVYTAAPLKRAEHPLMRWVGEAEVVRVDGEEQVSMEAVLRALEKKVGRTAGEEEARSRDR